MKTIRKSKSIRVYSLVTALLLTLLLSLQIGTVVAPKPDSPGKSVKTWDLKIWIGNLSPGPTEDIVLTAPEYLVAEEVPCSGSLWDLPKKKGRGSNPHNYDAYVNLFGWEEDDCGTYFMAHVVGEDSSENPTYLDGFGLESYDTVYVSIQHYVSRMGADYWTFVIQWMVDLTPNNYAFYEFRAWTDRDENLEGILSEEEGWLVPFNGANGENAILYSDWTDVDPLDGVPDNFDWKGPVSFTVKITREPHVD